MFEQMKGLTPKQKVEYYVQYYGVITAVILIAVAVAISFIVQRVTAKTPVAGVAVVNSVTLLSEESSEQEYMDDLLRSMEIDPAKNMIDVNSGIHIGDSTDVQMSAAGIQMLQALIVGHSIDIAFTDESFRDAFMNNDCFADLRDYLDDSLLEKYAEDLVYYTSEETGEEIAAMIRISPDTKWMQGMKWYERDCYAGIIVVTRNEEVAVHMLLRALGEEEF